MSWAFKDPYGLNLRNAIWLANEDFKERKRARHLLAVDMVAKEATRDLSNTYTDWDLGCMSLVLFDMGWAAEKVSEMLDLVQKKSVEMQEADVTCETIWDVVREYGLDVTHV